MPRSFASATPDRITFSLGAGASVNGAITLAGIARKATDTGAAATILTVGNAAASRRTLLLSNANVIQLRSNNATDGATTFTAAEGWALICVTKAAGTATARTHKYVYSTNTWTHANTPGTLGDSTPTSNSLIGTGGGTAAPWNGDIAVASAWAAAFTDAQVESLPFSLPAWFQVSPNGLWVLDQSATGMLVNDLTGNGANQSAITGTTVGTSNVPVFSYGAPIVVALHQPPAQSAALTPATITVTPVAVGASPGTVSLALTQERWPKIGFFTTRELSAT